jgi:hypothetical protein
LWHHFHPANWSGITHLVVPNKDAQENSTTDVNQAVTWKMETKPQQVLDTLFSRNVTHFDQAEKTSFTQSPLIEQLCYTGMTPAGQALIQKGELILPPDPPSPHAHEIMARLGEDLGLHQTLPDLLTLENFTSTIRKWKEATSTSPSGKHLGHYKSLLSLDSQINQYTEEIPGPSILKVLSDVASSAFNTGITMPQWTKVTTCMIEKIPGTPRIKKLYICMKRTITLSIK